MASSLLKKLSIMTAQTGIQKPKKESHVIIREYCECADESVYHLSQSALLDMGLTGGTFDIEKALFIDTETTGLSGGAGTVAFLIGIGFIFKGLMTVRQYIIPDYSCEAEMLSELARVSQRFETVVHFNGTRFDMPLIRERFTMKRMNGMLRDFNELDLLKPSRKIWKLRLGCCRLKYLEETVLGMPRDKDDIPGSEIPARYFESVKTGNLSLLDDIIDHNRQDILTLSKLLCVLNDLYLKPESADDRLDVFSLGKAFEQLGKKTEARKLYTIASLPRPVKTVHDLRADKYAGEANLRLYHMYRRSGEYEKCEATLKNMIKRKQQGQIPYIELAKLYEHRLKRLEDALAITKFLLKDSDDPEILKRKHRLEIKIGG